MSNRTCGWITLPVVAVCTFLIQPESMAAEGTEVVIKGALQCDAMCPQNAGHTRVLVAVDGSPEIVAIVKKILDEFYPERGLDADAAEKLQEQFNAKLKFYLSPDSPAQPPPGQQNPGPKHYCHCASPCAITGTIYEKEGKKWIKATKYESVGLKYPAKMMMPDKPFVMPEKEMLDLKINATLTLKCIKIPPGNAYMGEHIYVATRYLEQFPRPCTLTKPYYVSEIPITQEDGRAHV